jgi:hypothetical protein
MTGTEYDIIIQPNRKTAHHWKGTVQGYANHELVTVLV